MRRVKQSRALHVHNGDTVNKSRGGELRTNSAQVFHKQAVIRHSAGQVWLGHPAHTLGQGWGRGQPTSAYWGKNDTWGEGGTGGGETVMEKEGGRKRERERGRHLKLLLGLIFCYIEFRFLLEISSIINLSIVSCPGDHSFIWCIKKRHMTDKVHFDYNKHWTQILYIPDKLSLPL